MALFLDVHNVGGALSVDILIETLARDLEKQSRYQVSYLRRWIDPDKGKIFCLIEADSVEDARSVHLEAHGLLADEIYAVTEYA